MTTRFDELYRKLAKDYVENKEGVNNYDDYDPHHLDCLLNPEKYPPILQIGECNCPSGGPSACIDSCIFEAITKDENGKLIIDKDLCAGCCACVDACKADRLTASRDILPALSALHQATGPVYVLIAPAFLGQFNEDVTPGKLRNAFKYLGFAGMIEVALFADILTLKEALEFDKNIVTERDYQLTSCCCPMWIGMIRRVYHDLMPHVPGAVSPMVACGRTIKILHPDAITVFIGPCVAKKAEAREKDIKDAVDYVLTFQEVQDIFEFAGIDPVAMEESEKDHSSRAGRIYARTGGVSEAVESTLERLSPDRKLPIKTKQADGVPACKQMINDLIEGKTDANFFEGMGCVGGCVGGPKVMIDKAEGKRHVDNYGEKASYATPIDNPYVIELLHRLGFDTVGSLLKHSDIFTRDFRD